MSSTPLATLLLLLMAGASVAQAQEATHSMDEEVAKSPQPRPDVLVMSVEAYQKPPTVRAYYEKQSVFIGTQLDGDSPAALAARVSLGWNKNKEGGFFTLDPRVTGQIVMDTRGQLHDLAIEARIASIVQAGLPIGSFTEQEKAAQAKGETPSTYFNVRFGAVGAKYQNSPSIQAREVGGMLRLIEGGARIPIAGMVAVCGDVKFLEWVFGDSKLPTDAVTKLDNEGNGTFHLGKLRAGICVDGGKLGKLEIAYDTDRWVSLQDAGFGNLGGSSAHASRTGVGLTASELFGTKWSASVGWQQLSSATSGDSPSVTQKYSGVNVFVGVVW